MNRNLYDGLEAANAARFFFFFLGRGKHQYLTKDTNVVYVLVARTHTVESAAICQLNTYRPPTAAESAHTHTDTHQV